MSRSSSESTPDYRYAELHGEWNLIRTVERRPSDPAEAKARELAAALDQWLTLHPDGNSPHPGWIPPNDYATAARSD